MYANYEDEKAWRELVESSYDRPKMVKTPSQIEQEVQDILENVTHLEWIALMEYTTDSPVLWALGEMDV